MILPEAVVFAELSGESRYRVARWLIRDTLRPTPARGTNGADQKRLRPWRGVP